MAWTSPMTAVANDVFTAAQFNTHVRDNLLETAPAKATTAGSIIVSAGTNSIAERNVVSDRISTDESTTSTSFTDLTTVGPEVTVTTGTQALVFYTSGMYNSLADTANEVSYAVSGSSTISATGTNALIMDGIGANEIPKYGTFNHESGLTAGSNTFTMKYRASAGTGNFFDRHLIVVPI